MRVVQRQRPQSQTLQRKENRRRDLRAHIPRSDRVKGEALQKDYQDRRELRDAVFHEITALLLAEATVLVLPDELFQVPWWMESVHKERAVLKSKPDAGS